ncbi:MAG: asparaginase [Pseudomonadota bacterium]
MTANPVLVEVTRGNVVESRHRGAFCVVDGDGKTVLSLGDVELPIFPRSAIKAIQALPLIESGAADAYGLDDRALSLACSSHSGESKHVAMAMDMLQRAGCDDTCLECGGHWSSQDWVMREQAKIYDTTPPAICNNCSGKHAGFICTSVHNGIDPKGYIGPDHPTMENVRGTLEAVTGAAHTEEMRGTDGCSIPTYAIGLDAMARGFAKMATGAGLEPQRAAAGKRLLDACMNEPYYMAGTNRFCTNVMTLGDGRLFAKTGAEGVFCGAIPEMGLGIALKCDDGQTRASEALMAAIFNHLLPIDDPLQRGLSDMANVPIHNRNDIHTGDIRAQVAF